MLWIFVLVPGLCYEYTKVIRRIILCNPQYL
jgi:hypothetical protein